jgi:hypothetical protein
VVPCFHEKPNLNINASRSKPRAFASHGTANPRSPHGNKDRGSIADTGGSASGMDRRCVRVDASELKPLDAPSERSRVKGLGTHEAAWASTAVKPKSSAAIRGRFREASFGIWVTASSMGWSHLGGSSEASVWDILSLLKDVRLAMKLTQNARRKFIEEYEPQILVNREANTIEDFFSEFKMPKWIMYYLSAMTKW